MLNINLNNKKTQAFLQFVQFCLVGGSNVIIMLITYYICIYLGTSVYVANTLGFITSVGNAYIWNVLWVFKKYKNDKRVALIKFFVVYIFTYLLSMLMLYITVDILGISKLIVPFINIAVTTPINFLLSKFWTFKHDAKEE